METKKYSTTVGLKKCSGYHFSEMGLFVEAAVSHFQLSGNLRDTRVLLKPNLISSAAPELACTNGKFIAAVAGWFLDQGAKVRLGDSPAFGSVERVCQKQGIKKSLQGLNVQYVGFSDSVSMELACGTVVPVAREALECDLLVGLPKLKAHNQLYVTMAVKNLFGTVVGINKAMLHMTKGSSHDRFARIILDLVSLFPKQIHLIDGIEAMHKSGPMDGESLDLKIIGAATSPVALDTALLAVLGLPLTESPLWRVASGENRTDCRVENIVFPFFSPADFDQTNFVPPPSINPVRFNPFRFLSGSLKRFLLKFQS